MLVEYLVHHLDLGVVVPGAERAHLRQPPLLRPRAHLVGIRVEHPPVLLAVFLVLRPRVSLAQGPIHAHLERGLEPRGGRWDDALRTHAHRDVIEEGLRELLLDVRHVALVQVGADHPDAAVDVEAHAAGGDDRVWVGHVEGGDVSDGEAVPGVDVRERDALADDAGEAGDVGELLDRGEEAADVAAVHVLMELVEHERLEVLVHVEDAGDAHVGNEALAHAPLRRRDALQELHLLGVGAPTAGEVHDAHGDATGSEECEGWVRTLKPAPSGSLRAPRCVGRRGGGAPDDFLRVLFLRPSRAAESRRADVRRFRARAC